MKRTLAGVAATTLAVGGMLVATAAPASAHNNAVEVSCSALTVNLDRYSTGNAQWSKRDGHRQWRSQESGERGNALTVVIGGEVVEELTDFGTDYHRTFPIDDTKATDWSVVVDAVDGDQYDVDESGTTTPCKTPVPSDEIEVQVGLYLYPKLHEGDAAWDNSGKQELLDTRTITLGEDELDDLVRAKDYWFTSLPEDNDFVVAAEADLCRGWGIQQDLLMGGPSEYTMPQNITYPDGSLHGDKLIDWTHQELSDFGIDLPSAADCATPEVPEVEEPTVVVPQAPAGLEVCGAEPSDVMLPADTAEVTYTRTEQGIVATPTADHVFGDNLGGYTRTVDGVVLFPAEDLLPTAEDCALVPGDIAAVCEGDTPYLSYGVSLPKGIEVDGDTPLTITFINPDGGENYVAADQPLEGRLLWPGATDTAPKQWPGWEQQDDGSYVETDGNYAWTRDGVQVLFEVNPEYSTVVDYPPASSECANPIGVGGPDTETVADDSDAPSDDAAGGADSLPQTGATVGVVAGLAVLLIAGGGTLFWLRRRVQH